MAKFEEYDILDELGKGSYGVVIKARHRPSQVLVAIKRYFDTDDERCTKKVTQRELKALKMLKHEHVVQLLVSFRRKRRTFLVFEYVHHTLLEEMERRGAQRPMEEETVRKYMWQVLSALDYIHSKHMMHRDIKPENILISRHGVVKLCDFGFARSCSSIGGHTDYVATRWYRAPELLCGERSYDYSVDVWACGCLMAEMLLAAPLYAGDSDVDQLYRIMRSLGPLPKALSSALRRNPTALHGNNSSSNNNNNEPASSDTKPLQAHHDVPKRGYCLDDLFGAHLPHTLALIHRCLEMESTRRCTARSSLQHAYFQHDDFLQRFVREELRHKLQRDFPKENALILYVRRQSRESTTAPHSRTAASSRLSLPNEHNNNNKSSRRRLNNYCITPPPPRRSEKRPRRDSPKPPWNYRLQQHPPADDGHQSSDYTCWRQSGSNTHQRARHHHRAPLAPIPNNHSYQHTQFHNATTSSSYKAALPALAKRSRPTVEVQQQQQQQSLVTSGGHLPALPRIKT